MEKDLISILVPVFNAQDHIKECLKSLQLQTYKNIEIVCIDDASTDNSVKIIREVAHSDPRIKLVRQPKNSGISKALNLGLQRAKARYIGRMDSDDRTLPTRIALQKDVLDNCPEIGLVGSWIQLFGDESSVWHYRQNDEFIKALFLFRSNGVPHNSILVRREIYEQFEYDSDYDGVEDTELWCRIIKNRSDIKFANIPKVLTFYRKHKQQTSVARVHTQMQTYRAIIKDYIEFFCGAITDKELNAHFQLIEHKPTLSIDELCEIGLWLQKLKYHYELKFRDSFYAIDEKWYQLCRIQRIKEGREIYAKFCQLKNRFDFI